VRLIVAVDRDYTLRVDRLFTPWRRDYIERVDARPTACFLCDSVASHDDRANLVLLRARTVFVLLNLFPYNSGHLMVAPYAHTGDLVQLDPDALAEVMLVTQRSVDVLNRVYRPDAFNLGMNLGRSAGAGVPDHLHMHVVPRWNGDTNFMPIVGGTKVLPESLDQTYDRLEPSFRAPDASQAS
jgi:ATP adenylyltransferase